MLFGSLMHMNKFILTRTSLLQTEQSFGLLVADGENRVTTCVLLISASPKLQAKETVFCAFVSLLNILIIYITPCKTVLGKQW